MYVGRGRGARGCRGAPHVPDERAAAFSIKTLPFTNICIFVLTRTKHIKPGNVALYNPNEGGLDIISYMKELFVRDTLEK